MDQHTCRPGCREHLLQASHPLHTAFAVRTHSLLPAQERAKITVARLLGPVVVYMFGEADMPIYAAEPAAYPLETRQWILDRCDAYVLWADGLDSTPPEVVASVLGAFHTTAAVPLVIRTRPALRTLWLDELRPAIAAGKPFASIAAKGSGAV